MTVKELEAKLASISRDQLRQIANKVGFDLPEGSEPRITLLKSNGERMGDDASAQNWSAKSGVIDIQFPFEVARVGSGGEENFSIPDDLEFHPVEIRGEPLSATLLRERR